MRILGFVLLALGAATMTGAFFYDPFVRTSYDERFSRQVSDLNNAIADRSTGIPTPLPEEADYPEAVYSPARAANRQLAFMGGGALLLAGAIFAAMFSRPNRRRDDDEAPPAP